MKKKVIRISASMKLPMRYQGSVWSVYSHVYLFVRRRRWEREEKRKERIERSSRHEKSQVQAETDLPERPFETKDKRNQVKEGSPRNDEIKGSEAVYYTSLPASPTVPRSVSQSRYNEFSISFPDSAPQEVRILLCASLQLPRKASDPFTMTLLGVWSLLIMWK